MRTFLRFLALAFLIGGGVISNAHARGPGGRLWGRNPIPNSNVLRLDGREYVVRADLNYGANYFSRLAATSDIPAYSTLRTTVSIQMADGSMLSGTVRPMKVTLIMAGRPYWTSPLSPLIYWLANIWLPPGGFGQYQASGIPSLGEGLTLTARIEIRTARGTTIVNLPVTTPRIPAGLDLTP
jgi:hypothetical protein